MEHEQLEIMRVIQFPKNRQYENKIRNEKLEVAIRILEVLVAGDADFHIVIDSESALKIFEDNNDKSIEYLLLSTNEEKGKNVKINGDNTVMYEITGDELK